MAVKNLPGGGGDFFLDNCTHEEAVNALKRCKDKVVLLVAKTDTHYPSSPTIGSMHPLAASNFMPSRTMGPRSVSEEEFAVPRQVIKRFDSRLQTRKQMRLIFITIFMWFSVSVFSL